MSTIVIAAAALAFLGGMIVGNLSKTAGIVGAGFMYGAGIAAIVAGVWALAMIGGAS
jgi:hypothetical protein